MPRPLRIALVVLASLLVLLVAALAYIVVTFDPNDHKALLIERVRADHQRTLAIPGPIRLTVFPRLGVELGPVSLSERRRTDEFASWQSARVSLALWPLLRREVVVDRVAVTGLRVRMTRFKDGRLSTDDLGGDGNPEPAAAAASASPLPRLDIAGIAISDATVSFDDQQAARRWAASAVNLTTGRIVPGQPAAITLKGRLDGDAPKLAADLALEGRLTLGPAPGTLQFTAMKATLAARLDGDPLTLSLSGDVDADTQAPRITVKGLALEGTLPGPRGPLTYGAQGSLAFHGGDKARAEARLEGRFDESRFKLALQMPRLAPAAFRFDAEVDRLDLDRYRRAAPAPAAAASGPERPLDLRALRDLDASGELRIGALQVMNLKLTGLRAGLRAAAGRVLLDPLAASLYDGRVAGTATLQATTPPRLALAQQLDGVSIGPLVRDLTGRELVDGRGTVTLDVTTAGATTSAMTRALAGRAAVRLADGAVRGINVAQAIRKAKARVGGGSTDGTAAADERTDFSELGATFTIAGGVAHNEDLSAKSPLLRVGGAGDIDLGAGRLDYLVKATVVSTLEGQGGPELQALRGQTVPVRLTGPFDAVDWKIDFGGLLREAARKELDSKGDALKEQARQKLGDKLKGLLGR